MSDNIIPSPNTASTCTPTPRGADIIARYLYDHGARHAYGIPGGEVLALMDALNKAGIHFTLTKHENSAGFMAEGFWHATGHLPILLATLGPGVANAVNVVANAQQDRVPLVFLTGRVDSADAAQFTHQVFDHQAVLAPLVKGSFCITAGAIEATIHKAIALARDGQHGPVHIDVPVSLAQNPASPNACATRPSANAMQPAASAEFAEACDALERAKTIVMIAGVDSVNQHAGYAIEACCKTWHVPLITTYKAKGLMSEDHELSLGGAGLSPKADAILLPLVREADVVICAGYDPIEMRIGWQHAFLPQQFVIDLASAPPSHFMHKVDSLFVGDIAASLMSFKAHATIEAHWPQGKIASVKDALAKAFARDAAFTPATVFHTLRHHTPREKVITADSGAHRILLSQIWRCFAPRGMLQSTGLCTMGCSLPLAMGYQMGRPKTPVVAVMGDAGLEMVLGELATLRDLKLPLTVVVMVDESLALIELKQRASQLPELGVRFGKTDFAAVAKAMGGVGIDVESEKALIAALDGAKQTRDHFTLIACHVKAEDYVGRI